MDKRIESYCGIKCAECEYFADCGGCIGKNGDMAWGNCPVAKCAISRSRRFCGECGDIPCETLKGFAYDKEHGDNGARIENCNAIKAALVAEARVGINPVSVCGHHCDYCFLGQWCGGCRSNYNCCSYATISEGGVCANVKCADEKGYDGCWQCAELDGCTKGYYEKTDEYIAKATAKFIGKHGQECYTATLKKAIDSGEKYAASFDEKGSIEGALALLEKYL